MIIKIKEGKLMEIFVNKPNEKYVPTEEWEWDVFFFLGVFPYFIYTKRK